MPLWPPCLMDSPFIWLKRLSSLMLFSCMLSIGLCRGCMFSWPYPEGPGWGCAEEGGPGLGPIML